MTGTIILSKNNNNKKKKKKKNNNNNNASKAYSLRFAAAKNIERLAYYKISIEFGLYKKEAWGSHCPPDVVDWVSFTICLNSNQPGLSQLRMTRVDKRTLQLKIEWNE